MVIAAAAAITAGAFSLVARSATVTWLPDADGLWNIVTNWSSNPLLPRNNDDVTISVGGATVRTITHSVGADSIHSLTSDEIIVLSGGSLALGAASTINADFNVSGGSLLGSGSLTVNGALNWTGGTLGSSSTALLRAAGPLNIDTSGATVTLNRTLENDTTAAWTGGSNFVFSGATFNNIAAGIFNTNATGTMTSTGGGNAFNNAGTFNRTGAGTTTIATAFNNTGTLNVQGGTLALNGGGTQSGHFVISPGADLSLGGGHTLAAASDITGAGNLGFTAAINAANGSINIGGVMTVSGGTNTFNGAVTAGSLIASGGIANFNTPFSFGSLTLSGADLSGSAVVSVNGPLTWSAGTMSGTGKTVVAAGQSLTINSSASVLALHRALENDGTTNWDSGTNAISFNGGTFNNAAGGVFSASVTASMISGGGVNLFSNSGTFNRTGVGTTTIAIPFNNLSPGGVNVQGGTLALSGGGTSSGPFNISSGGTLNFTAGVHSLSAGATVSGTGALVVSGASVTTGDTVNVAEADLTNGTWTVNGPATFGSGSMTNGTLTGSGTVTLPAAFTWSRGTMSGGGKTVVGPAGILGIDTSAANVTLSRVMENNGTVNWSGDLNGLFLTGGTFNNQPGAVFNDSAASTIHNNGVGNSFNNAGTYNRIGAGIATIVAPFNNTGTLNVQGGTLTFTGSVAQIAGANLTGGTWNISSGATLDIPLATVTANGGNITLDGLNSTFASINGLTSNSGSFTMRNGRNFDTVGAFSNSGTLAVGSGSTFTMAAGQAYNQSAGTTSLQGGTLSAAAGVNINGGSLSGSGTISGNTTVLGKLSPGASAGGIGITGNLTLGGASQSLFELGGTAVGTFGTVSASGSGALGGTLGVSFINGFQTGIKGSDTFTILTAGSPLAGAFGNIASGGRLATSDGFGKFRVVYAGGNSVTLSDFNTVRWVPDADGDWSTVANWTSNPVLPAPIEDVIIDVGGATVRTITHSTGTDAINSLTSNENLVISGGSLSIAKASTITAGLTISGGTLSGSGDVTVNGPLSWSSGTMSGSGKTIVASGGSLGLDTTAADITLSRVLENNAAATWAGGNAWSFSGGTFNNHSGATFGASGSGTMTNAGGVNAFNNAGTFNRTGAGTTTIDIPFNNTGSVNVQGGTLAINGGGATSGTITVSGGATLNLSGYTYALGSNLTGAGTFNFSGIHNLPAGTFNPTGTVNFNSGTITINNAFIPAALGPISSATVNFNAPQAFPGLTLSGGTLSGTGDVTVNGALSWSGNGGTMSGSGKTIVASGGSLSLDTTTAGITLSRVLENNAAATWTGGNAWSFDGGTLNNQLGATFTTSAAAAIASGGGVNAFNNAGTFNRTGLGTTTIGVPFNNTGTVNAQGGALILGGAVSQVSGTALTGGTWNVLGSSSLDITGVNLASNAANITLNGPGSAFPAINTLTSNSGSFTITNGRNFTTAGAFGNAGTLTIGTGSTFSTAPAQAYSQSAGITNLQSGSLTAAGVNINGGSLTGNGTITGTLSVGGVLSPGNSAGNIGVAGNLNLGGTAQSVFELGGTAAGSFDTVTVTGSAALGGTLGVSFINGFQSTIGKNDTFAILTSGAPISGAFGNVANGARLRVSGGPGSLLASYSGNSVTLSSFYTGPAWIPNADGNWATAGNWSTAPGLPGAADDVLIDVGGATVRTITHSTGIDAINSLSSNENLVLSGGSLSIAQPSTINAGLTLSGDTLTGSGDVTVNGPLSWSGGTMSGSGKTIVASGGSLSLDTATAGITLSRVLENNAAATWTGGNAWSFNGGTFNNQLGATFTTGAAAAMTNAGGVNAFNNAGTFKKIAATSLDISIPFNNTGTVSVQGGSLNFNSAGGVNSSLVDVAAGAAVNFANNFTHAASSSITGAGAVNFTGGSQDFSGQLLATGPVSVGGTVNFNAAQNVFGPLTLTGTLGGTANVTASNSLTWTAGSMSGSGRTIIPVSATLNVGGAGTVILSRTLDNSGIATYTGGSFNFNGGTFNNNAGASFNTAVAGSMANAGGTNALNNAGTFNKTTPTAFDVNVPFNNTGTLNVQGGTLNLTGGVAQQVGTTLTGGTWNVQDNAALNIIAGSDIATNHATVSLSGANASFARLNALTTNDGSLSLLGGRGFKTAGDLSNTGLITVGRNSVLDVNGALTNTNLIDVSGKLIVQASPATRDGVLTSITSQIQSARNTHPVLWQGTGITSAASAADPRQLTGLSVILNDKGDGTPLFTSFGNQPVDTNSILLKYTYNGDANLDGLINFDDYFQINTGFLSNGKLTGYRWGDFNYDGLINFDDYFLINSAFLGQGNTVLSVSASAVQAVPEPAGPTLLLLLGVGLLRRRRRRNSQ